MVLPHIWKSVFVQHLKCKEVRFILRKANQNGFSLENIIYSVD